MKFFFSQIMRSHLISAYLKYWRIIILTMNTCYRVNVYRFYFCCTTHTKNWLHARRKISKRVSSYKSNSDKSKLVLFRVSFFGFWNYCLLMDYMSALILLQQRCLHKCMVSLKLENFSSFQNMLISDEGYIHINRSRVTSCRICSCSAIHLIRYRFDKMSPLK